MTTTDRAAGRGPRPLRTRGPRSVAIAMLPALLYLGVIAAVTLGPVAAVPAGGSSVLSLDQWLDPAAWIEGTRVEFLANVLLFVPLGALSVLAAPRVPAALLVAAGGAASLLIEVVQLASARVSDPRDLVANTAGAAVGVLLGRLLRRLG